MEIEEYRNLDITNYINYYEVMLVEEFEEYRRRNAYNENGELISGMEINYKQIEVDFLNNLIKYHSKKANLLLRYFDHCDNTGKENSAIRLYDSFHNSRMHFIERKLEGLNIYIDLKDKFLNTPPKSKKPKFKGKDFNLSERFKILNETIGLWESIERKKISEMKKYELLALALNIDESNAQKLVNGSYRSKDRPELVETYLNELN